MRIKFTEEPLVWIGARTWPWVQTFRETKKHGKRVVFFATVGLLIGMIRSC